MAQNSKVIRVLPIIFVIFLALLFVCGLLYFQYWYLPNKSKNDSNTGENNYQKESWRTYSDEEFGFTFYYPTDSFKFEEKEAVFNIPEGNSIGKISVAKNIPLLISFVNYTSPDGVYTVHVNPLEMTISATPKPAIFFGLDYFVSDEEKDKCKDNQKEEPETSCESLNIKISGADGIKLKAADTDYVREALYITEPGKSYILKIEYYFNDSELSGKIKNKDSVLRYNIIQSIISKGFTL